MIDMHTHILPHIDDGARDSSVSVAMLQAELKQGVHTVLLSPHYYGRRHSPARFLERRNSMFERLKPKIPEGINVRLGAEVHFTGINVLNADEFCSLAIEGTKYVLVELPFDTAWHGEILDKLATLIAETGYTPIIAHVERYDEVLKNPTIVSSLVAMGCLIQVNTYAFLNKKEKQLAFALLKHGLVHCIGSDTHDMEQRKPNHLDAKKAFENAGFANEWQQIQQNMQNVFADKAVERALTTPVKKFLWWYF